MIDRLRTIVAGCVCMLCMPIAEAADGRIMFSGSVVTPTCNVATDQSEHAITATPAQRRFRRTCAGQGFATAPSQIHTVTTRRLTGAEPDRVLNYFDAYVRTQQADAVPMLITQTYE